MNRVAVARFIPAFRRPALPPLSAADSLALVIATGIFSGYMVPFAASWGSLVGFAVFAPLILLGDLTIYFAATIVLMALCVWSATRCERIFGVKDPKPVVIDEIACVPVALWPLLTLPSVPLWVWPVLFVAYRLFDLFKPWPARYVERVRGGVGVLLDDLVSAFYMGVALFGAMVLFR